MCLCVWVQEWAHKPWLACGGQRTAFCSILAGRLHLKEGSVQSHSAILSIAFLERHSPASASHTTSQHLAFYKEPGLGGLTLDTQACLTLGTQAWVAITLSTEMYPSPSFFPTTLTQLKRLPPSSFLPLSHPLGLLLTVSHLPPFVPASMICLEVLHHSTLPITQFWYLLLSA